MTRFAVTGLLLLCLGIVVGCGDGGSDDVPAGSKRVELDGLRFTLPAGLPVDEDPGDGQLFFAHKPGVVAQQPRVGATSDTSDSEFLNAVGTIRDVNTSGVRDFEPVSDEKIEVPGSDEARLLVHTFVTGMKGDPDVPTSRTTVVARKGKRYVLFVVAVPDSKRDQMDAQAIVRSLELT